MEEVKLLGNLINDMKCSLPVKHDLFWPSQFLGPVFEHRIDDLTGLTVINTVQYGLLGPFHFT